MSEISWLDGPILRPLFKILRRVHAMDWFVGGALKATEYIGNGFSLDGRHGIGRVKWSSFDRLILVGQSHLDAAWRWRTKQGIIKARATFKKALDHIDDPTLPTFTFSQPSPQYYQWMKDYYPDIYERIKKAVAAGRWVPIGGSWVEMDTNVPSGESLVRQRLYGQRFYLDEFGIIADMEFLQDCFGFNWNLPQIFKKSGARLFGSGKMFWNKTAKIPLGMCHWRGPDGTELPTLHIHFGYFLTMNYGKEYPLIYLLGKEGADLTANYQTKPDEYRQWRSREYMLESIFGYGLGDGGHGPIEVELWAVETLRKLYPKNVRHNQMGDVYQMYKKFFPRWATWNDEWFLDDHRGTYSSWTLVKRGNRYSENKMESVEKLAAIAAVLGSGADRQAYEKCWKTILYNQFHDILPGSSIPEVYVDYEQDLEEINNFFEVQIEKLSKTIISGVDIGENSGIPIVIFNPLSWDREDVIKIDIGDHRNGILRDNEGRKLETEIVPAAWLTDGPDEERNTMLLSNHGLPAFGIDVVYFNVEDADVASDDGDSDLNLAEENDFYLLENQYYKITISRSTGYISKLILKDGDVNVLNGESNVIRVFEDSEHADAWNIDPEYMDHLVDYDITDCQIEAFEDNGVRKCVKVTRKIEDSTFIQYIGLERASKLIILSMDIDMRNSRRMVKLEFNTDLKTNRTSSEIAYAYIDRTIEPTTKLDKARWEQNHQKFVSVYDEQVDLGITVVNNCKYGYNALKNTDGGVLLRETVLRTPKCTGYAGETIFVNRAPDGGLDPNMPSFADMETHHNITYGLCVHKGEWRDGSWKHAYELNLPHCTKMIGRVPSEKGSFAIKELPYSFVDISPSSVQIGAIKVAEDEEDLKNPKQYVLRLIERTGTETEARLKFDKNIKITTAEELDLLEINQMNSDVELADRNIITVGIAPYEIKTIRITLK